jgi:3-oxoacyl-(acyl-carrier-protein) synthase
MSQSTTISQANISSAKAIEFSIMELLTNRVDAILCGGAEELNMQTFLGYYLNKLLASNEIFLFFYNKDNSGTIIGEGASFVLLEKEENAKFPIIAKIEGYSSSFSTDIIKGIESNIINAIEKSNLKLEDIDIIFSSAGGNIYFDDLEKKAFYNVFGDRLSSIPVVAIKKFIGETIGASSLFQLAVSSSLKYINLFTSLYFYSKIEKEFIETKNFEIKSFNFKKILLNFSSECSNHSAIILNI